MSDRQPDRRPFPHPRVRPDWLCKVNEPILDPAQPIVDPHHHLWRARPDPYLIPDLVADISSGHNVLATVFIQCGQEYYPTGPEEMRPVGETEFIAGLVRDYSRRPYERLDVCAGIVGHADCRLGDRIDPVLEAHIRAGRKRFKGIRHSGTYDAGIAPTAPPGAAPGLYRDEQFRAGIRRLRRHGLTFETWVYHPQLGDLIDLLRHCPDQPVVLNHLGGPLGVGPYQDQRPEVLARWRASIAELSAFPNLSIKLGGLAMNVNGFGYHHRTLPPGSEELARDWMPYVETAINAFGVKRCMFESNFPVDKGMCSYAILWNAFKRMVVDYSADEKAALFHRTARQFYNLQPSSEGSGI